MTQVVLFHGRVGPMVRRFNDPVAFRDYVRAVLDHYGQDRCLWVGPHQLRVA
jgi:hypothetical protein